MLHNNCRPIIPYFVGNSIWNLTVFYRFAINLNLWQELTTTKGSALLIGSNALHFAKLVMLMLASLTFRLPREGGTHKSGCRRSRVVTFTAIRLRGPGFKPRPGQKFENENVCFRRTPAVVMACHPCRLRLIKNLRRRYVKPDF